MISKVSNWEPRARARGAPPPSEPPLARASQGRGNHGTAPSRPACSSQATLTSAQREFQGIPVIRLLADDGLPYGRYVILGAIAYLGGRIEPKWCYSCNTPSGLPSIPSMMALAVD